MKETIPMRGRMIHGRDITGELYEQSQQYDIENRVRIANLFETATEALLICYRAFWQWIEGV